LQEVIAGPPPILPVGGGCASPGCAALAIFTGLLLGGIIIILTTKSSQRRLAAIRSVEGLKAAWDILVTAYGALFTAPFGDPEKNQGSFCRAAIRR